MLKWWGKSLQMTMELSLTEQSHSQRSLVWRNWRILNSHFYGELHLNHVILSWTVLFLNYIELQFNSVNTSTENYIIYKLLFQLWKKLTLSKCCFFCVQYKTALWVLQKYGHLGISNLKTTNCLRCIPIAVESSMALYYSCRTDITCLHRKTFHNGSQCSPFATHDCDTSMIALQLLQTIKFTGWQIANCSQICCLMKKKKEQKIKKYVACGQTIDN